MDALAVLALVELIGGGGGFDGRGGEVVVAVALIAGVGEFGGDGYPVGAVFFSFHHDGREADDG